MALGHWTGRLVWTPLLKKVGYGLTSVILMCAVPLVGVLLVVAGVGWNMPRVVTAVAIGVTVGVLMFGWASAVLALAQAKRPDPAVSRYGFLARRRLRLLGGGPLTIGALAKNPCAGDPNLGLRAGFRG